MRGNGIALLVISAVCVFVFIKALTIGNTLVGIVMFFSFALSGIFGLILLIADKQMSNKKFRMRRF